MIIKTRIFEIMNSNGGKYNNLSELAYAMGISVSQIYRVREGKRYINQKFIIGAIKAFPKHNLDDLFYLTLELPTVTERHRRNSAVPSALGQVITEKEKTLKALTEVTQALQQWEQEYLTHTGTIMGIERATEELPTGAERSE